MFKQKIVRV